jgi:hypothetical protein
MQKIHAAVVEAEVVHAAVVEAEVVPVPASVHDLGLEVVENTPPIALGRGIRHIRAPQ